MAAKRELWQPASPRQAEFLQSNTDITVFGGAAGSGKAQPLDAKVLTPNGWVNMGDILVGTEVSTPDGKTAFVKAVYKFDSKPVYQITTATGRKTRACDEHLWLVNISQPKAKSLQKVVTTQEIITHLDKGVKVSIPVFGEPLQLGDCDLPFDPYLLGSLLGDGCLVKTRITLSTCDQETVEQFQQRLEVYGCKLSKLKSKYDHIIVNKRDTDENPRAFKNNVVSGIFKKLGLIGTNSETKYIPEQYLRASVEKRKNLLMGLLDTDGSNAGSYIEYTTISKKLCDDVVYLVRSLGGRAKVSERKTSYTYKGLKKLGKTSYRVFIRFRDNSEYFKLSRKKLPDESKGSYYDEIVSVEFIGYEKAQCISVDSNEHLYITDDFIVTHNTWQGLTRFLRYINEPLFIGYVIRKTQAALKSGTFETAIRLFSAFEPRIKVNRVHMTIKFPSGAIIHFKGLDGQASIEYFQGQEISAAMVDEATHIKYEEISWLMTRLRTNANMKPNVWFTCNPDPDHFLAEWVDWYLYPKKTYINGIDVGGRVDPEKNGKVRYYLTIGGLWFWGDDYDVLLAEHQDKLTDINQKPMSLRFIGATCDDNPPIFLSNPNYKSNLLNKSKVEAERLVYGNWYIREEGIGYWKKDWCEVIPAITEMVAKRCRCWDLAYTVPTDVNPDPDYTAGVLMSRGKSGTYYVEHVIRERKRVGDVYDFIIQTSLDDYKYHGIIPVYIPEDPAAGKLTFHYAKTEMLKRGVFISKVKGSNKRTKLERFKNFAAASESGAVKILRGDWNDSYFSELEAFTGTRQDRHDDMVDASSDAFNALMIKREIKTKISKAIRM